MNWISFGFFGIAVLIGCTMFKKGADVMSPGRIFGLTWSIVLGLASLKLSRLQFDWTTTQWLYVLIGPISFLIGLLATYVINVGTCFPSVTELRRKMMRQTVNHVRLFYIIFFAFVTYLGGMLAISSAKGPMPIFAPVPSAARTEFSVFGIGLLVYNMPVVVFFTLVFHLLVPGQKVKKSILKIIAFVTLIIYLFLLQRYALIMISLMAITLLYYASSYVRLKTVLIFVLFACFVFYAIATLRSGQVVQMALYQLAEMKFPARYAMFTDPYMYVAMNVENFVNAVTKLSHHTFGYYTFDFVFSSTQLKYPMKDYFGLEDAPYTLGGFNTFTLFWTYYRDFGILGISVIPLVLGMFVGSRYYAMRLNPTIERVTVYCVIVFVMVLSFFVNLLGFLWFIYILAWLGITLSVIRVKTISYESS